MPLSIKTGAVKVKDSEGDYVDIDLTLSDGYAPLESPAFTGTPTAPTPGVSDDSTKVATTAFVQDVVDSLDAGDIEYSSAATYSNGSTGKAISDLNGSVSNLSGAINGLTANDIANNSNVTGTKVKDALNTLNGAINSLSSDDIANDSTKISGATVTAALDALRDNIKTNTAWKNVSASYGTLQAYYYESGTAITDYDLPENYVYVLCMQYKATRGTAIAIRWQSGAYRMWINICHDTWLGWKQVNGATSVGNFTLTSGCWNVWGPADADVATYSVTETGFYEVWFAPVLNVSNTNARIRLWLGSTLVAEQQCGFNSGEVRLPAAISYKGNINAGTTIYLSYQSDQGASAVRLLFGDNNYVRKIG